MSKMTKHERAQVVELLRCAADDAKIGAFTRALDHLGIIGEGAHENAVHMNASSAFYDTPLIGWTDEEYRHRLLEAAQRVEEGTWP